MQIKSKNKQTEEERVCKALAALVRDRISKNWNHMGIRCETEDLSEDVRSKAVRAYIVDLLGNYDDVEGLHELEEAINESIHLYYKN